MGRSRAVLSRHTVGTESNSPGSGSSIIMDQERMFDSSHGMEIVSLNDAKISTIDASGYISASSDDMSSSEDELNSAYMRRTSLSSSSLTSTMESVGGKKDIKIAARLRILVAILFVIMGIVFPIIIFKKTRSREEEAFQERFDALATSLITSVEEGFSRKFRSLDSLRIAISSSVHTAGSSWPYVSLPDFDLRADSIRRLGGLLSVSLHPLVSLDQKERWQDYSVSNIDWLEQSINRTASHNGTSTAAVTIGDVDIFKRNPNNTMFCRSPNAPDGFPQEIFNLEPKSRYGACVDSGENSTFPLWQSHPPVPAAINLNALSFPDSIKALQNLKNGGDIVISRMFFPDSAEARLDSPSREGRDDGFINLLLGKQEKLNDALALIYYPIFRTIDFSSGRIVGIFVATIQFGEIFSNNLPTIMPNQESLLCVMENGCGDVVSYLVTGDTAQLMGSGDRHNRDFSGMGEHVTLEWLPDTVHGIHARKNGVTSDKGFCPYTLSVYPHDNLYDSHITSQPIIFSISFAMAVFAVTMASLTHDYFVQRRMKRALKSAKENRAIVSSLFPENIRARMIQEEEDRKKAEKYKRRMSNDDHARRNSNEEPSRASGQGRRVSNEREGRRMSTEPGVPGTVGTAAGNVTHAGAEFTSVVLAPAKMKIRSYLKEDKESTATAEAQQCHYPRISISSFERETNPLADLFPHCTVLFADISGFTAWSSEREPTQVFTLLQAIFQRFDVLARKRDVFKVETIGDCYVAVTGLPDPQHDHAVRMTKFARACSHKFSSVVKRLETQLGPGTSDLRMRFGLHSGPVTAGVLRGEKSRFQLFGDTVNTASRMESTGHRNRIQISLATAALLISHGKEHWIQPREDLVHAKGKGAIQTYWVLTRKQKRLNEEGSRPKFIQPSLPDSGSDIGSAASGNISDWAIDGLDESLRESYEPLALIVSAHTERLIDWQVDVLLRLVKQILVGRDQKINTGWSSSWNGFGVMDDIEDVIPVQSITESVELQEFDPKVTRARVSTAVEVSDIVVSELRCFVTMIATRYRDNPFHSFAHAAHVSMSCQKILGRVVTPEDVNYTRDSISAVVSDLHEYTYGITSDPLTQLAIMIAILAHDVDHTGVPNLRRNIEEPDLALKYQGRSVAEQNSIDMTWELLMSPAMRNLQGAIFASKKDVLRFRQLLVNLIMATDIFEPQQQEARNARWEKLFHSDLRDKVEGAEYRSLKASIVIEHIIQAADVSHTMQHWQVYMKWNERLFQESYKAYESGRSEVDPSEGWYEGEIWFFDHYVIPLAKKLDECGVFGVTSDECLNYAMQNRQEWQSKGVQLVKEMVEHVKAPKKPLSHGTRRNSIGYMARRSATFMMSPGGVRTAASRDGTYGYESDQGSIEHSFSHLNTSNRSENTPIYHFASSSGYLGYESDDSRVIVA